MDEKTFEQLKRGYMDLLTEMIARAKNSGDVAEEYIAVLKIRLEREERELVRFRENEKILRETHDEMSTAMDFDELEKCSLDFKLKS
ncbi:MAG: hypothetical protein ACFFB3_11800 [Candidatus Hodarchaeota archaeon]